MEDNIETLRANGMAYINLDAAITGTKFSASASPLLQTALMNVLERVQDPRTNETLRNLWGDQPLPGLGAGSDYVAFQDHAGVSSIDMSFIGNEVPYHSCYDNFAYMKAHIDPDFSYHKTMAQVLALLILELADTPLLPFNMTSYGVALETYVGDLQGFIHKKIETLASGSARVNLASLTEAVKAAKQRLVEFDNRREPWMDQVGTVMGGLDSYGTIHRNSRNARMSNFETHLLDLEDGGGVPGREWFKHVIFAPQVWGSFFFFPFPVTWILTAVRIRRYGVGMNRVISLGLGTQSRMGIGSWHRNRSRRWRRRSIVRLTYFSIKVWEWRKRSL